MEKVYCIKCEHYNMMRTIKHCDYIKKEYFEDTPIIDNKDNNCFYYTPRQPKKKESSHFLGKISNFFKTYIG